MACLRGSSSESDGMAFLKTRGGKLMRLPDASPYACDVCQKRRDDDVNHWWVLTTELESADGKPLKALDEPEVYFVVLHPWSDRLATIPGAAHACGQDHAHLLVSRFMDHGNFADKAA